MRAFIFFVLLINVARAGLAITPDEIYFVLSEMDEAVDTNNLDKMENYFDDDFRFYIGYASGGENVTKILSKKEYFSIVKDDDVKKSDLINISRGNISIEVFDNGQQARSKAIVTEITSIEGRKRESIIQEIIDFRKDENNKITIFGIHLRGLKTRVSKFPKTRGKGDRSI